MTRCIQCTRCVRFAEEVAGVEEIGALYRGENMQITSYLEKAVTSELSGNVVDLCPVGALTSKPYAFEARPWELVKTLAIDVMDAVGTNIRIDRRGRAVLRVLPRINEDVNEEWAHDKTRHHVDGLSRRRLDKPYVRRDGKLVEATWDEAFDAIAVAAAGAGDKVAAIHGDLLDCETIFAAKALVKSCGSSLLEGRQTGMDYDVSSLGAVNFNTTIAGVEEADVVLLVGTNLRWEAPLVNTRVRKAIKRGAKVFAIGAEVDLTYKATWLGNDLGLLGKLPKAAADAFKDAKRPMVIVGGAALKNGHGAALALAKKLNLVRTLDTGAVWNGFNVLHMAASRMGGLMLGFASKGGIAEIVAAEPKLTFFLGADEVDFSKFANSFNVYIGHHGDKGAHAADVILPGASYAEKPGTYVNLEGRVQRGDKASFPPGDAREDWTILRALSERLGKTLPFDSYDQLRAAMFADTPALANEGLASFEWNPPALDAQGQGEVSYPIADFYLTNAICRASPTMQRCSAELIHGQDFAEAAE
jgi:NADH-quinone oxidoreductase subunit G